MGLRDVLGVKHPVIREDGAPHCHNCNGLLTGVPASKRARDPILCPFCRAKNYPDLRGSSPMYRKR